MQVAIGSFTANRGLHCYHWDKQAAKTNRLIIGKISYFILDREQLEHSREQ